MEPKDNSMKRSALHINCDMGESFGRYNLTDDEALMNYIDACNIACGFHAGDPLVIQNTIKLALKYNIEIGAHPSYPDRQGFGRRVMDIDASELESMVRYQICAINGMTQCLNGNLIHVKPHGALYNQASIDINTATAIVKATLSVSENLILFAQPKSKLSEVGKAAGLTVKHEAFIDRAYNLDGTLVSRKLKNSVIKDPILAKAQVKMIVEQGQVNTIDGQLSDMQAATFCIHGDNPNAIQILKHFCSETE